MATMWLAPCCKTTYPAYYERSRELRRIWRRNRLAYWFGKRAGYLRTWLRDHELECRRRNRKDRWQEELAMRQGSKWGEETKLYAR